ncbi:hypothetical protein [Bradyrhizobium sp. 186]|uniref:hypothetical protein n=1 Tax=Bradyrhizobium sp. 186 TaxID=2782654 RepID=UPI002001541F|nr:hypothetical protein [Bradyrhizobium sp. 186]
MKLALSGASGDIGSQSPRRGIDLRSAGWKPSKQPNPLDSVAQPYQGGAVVALDFTLEEARPKAACSICPTTT